MLEALLSAFAVNFFAELGDKTQLAILALSAKYERKPSVLVGSLAGLALATVIAVLAGNFVSGYLSAGTLRLASGALFILFGAYTLLPKDEERSEIKTGANPLLSSFALLFLMEMGDKTQLANMLLACNFPPAFVLAGAFLALAILSAAAFFVGGEIAKRVPQATVKKVAAALFVLIGLAMFLLPA